MLLKKIYNSLWYRITQYGYKKKFGEIGKKTTIISPLQLDNTKSIYIGENVSIHKYAWLMAVSSESLLKINNGTTIGHLAHIVAYNSVSIGENVLIADKVFISDCTHNYEDINIPIGKQGIHALKKVDIGDDSWIGENVCIQGASIGKHCIIGSNSVVVKSIPDYSVAVGAPARVIKKYDFEKKCWINVDFRNEM